MTKFFMAVYQYECRLFQKVNNYFENKYLNAFFRNITHIGGARFTISTVLILMIFLTQQTRMIAVASAIALAVSHIPVHIVKKLYPRKRPYLIIEKTKIFSNPLEDHSFPSGHTTAIFSVIIPFILFLPILAYILLPLGLFVGVSRIYLGLHYPSDVMAGGLLGTVVGSLCFFLIIA